MATMDGKSLVQEPKCNPHPKAPHGFDRNASHSADRYVCECEGWDAYDAGYQAGIEDTYKRMDALDRMAAVVEPHKNARELGLDYEPAGGTQVSKVWWDGEKLMAKPIPLEDIYQPAPVVPDVMTTAEGEHPEYVQGWNDCRQLMLQTRNNRHD